MRYASFPPIFLSDFPIFFHTPARRPFRKRQYDSLQAQVHFTQNASTFFLKRRSILIQTHLRFLSKHTYPCSRRHKTAQKRCFPTK